MDFKRYILNIKQNYKTKCKCKGVFIIFIMGKFLQSKTENQEINSNKKVTE